MTTLERTKAGQILMAEFGKSLAEIAASIKLAYKDPKNEFNKEKIYFSQIVLYRGMGNKFIQVFCETHDLVTEWTEWERRVRPPHRWIFNKIELDYQI